MNELQINLLEPDIEMIKLVAEKTEIDLKNNGIEYDLTFEIIMLFLKNYHISVMTKRLNDRYVTKEIEVKNE